MFRRVRQEAAPGEFCCQRLQACWMICVQLRFTMPACQCQDKKCSIYEVAVVVA